MKNTESAKKRILIIGTGGTIAGIGEDDNYKSGATDIGDLVRNLTEDAADSNSRLCEKVHSSLHNKGVINKTDVILEKVDITTINAFNLNSDDVTSKELIALRRMIDSYGKTYEGIIITHGTDTLEESAFFLSLTHSDCCPVIITCAMYPANSPKSDGPDNILFSLNTMCDLIDQGRKQDVFVCFNRMAIKADSCRKIYAGGEFVFSPCENSPAKMTSYFHHYDIAEAVSELPKVPIIWFYMDADSNLIDYYVNQEVKGFVIAGAGAGEMSIDFLKKISEYSKQGIVFVRSSKINNAPVNNTESMSENTVNAGNLSPEKAAMLLRLHLMSDY